MPETALQLSDLRRILRESAGVSPGVDLDADIGDVEFDDLGYDSVALMETAARISREYGRSVDDGELTGSTTPRQLLALLNR